MLPPLTPRLRLAGTALGCFGLIAYGLVLQHIKHVEPCPMCIIQRYAFVAVGLIALIAALHNPRLLGRRIYAGLLAVTAGAGLFVAFQQSWLQLHPPKVVECGPDLAYMINSGPLGQVLPKIFRGDGDCANIDWTFLGLSVANWSGICFAVLIVIALSLMLRWRTDRPHG